MDAGAKYKADEIAEMIGLKASRTRELLKHLVGKELIVESGEKEIVGIGENNFRLISIFGKNLKKR